MGCSALLEGVTGSTHRMRPPVQGAPSSHSPPAGSSQGSGSTCGVRAMQTLTTGEQPPGLTALLSSTPRRGRAPVAASLRPSAGNPALPAASSCLSRFFFIKKKINTGGFTIPLGWFAAAKVFFYPPCPCKMLELAPSARGPPPEESCGGRPVQGEQPRVCHPRRWPCPGRAGGPLPRALGAAAADGLHGEAPGHAGTRRGRPARG